MLLSNLVHCTLIEKDLKDYFHTNDTEAISPATLWAAHKVLIRGKIIQLSSCLKREHRAEIDNLTKKFHDLCKRSKREHTRISLQKLEAACLNLNLALTTKAKKHLHWSGVRFYSQKDKIGYKLASKLTPKPRHLAFPKICMPSGTLTQNLQRIMECLHELYASLYKDNNSCSPRA